ARSYKPERGPGGPWLYAVARNAIIDRSRARTEPAVEAPDQESHEPGLPDYVEASWTAWRVHRALEELSVNERSVIELAYWGGLHAGARGDDWVARIPRRLPRRPEGRELLDRPVDSDARNRSRAERIGDDRPRQVRQQRQLAAACGRSGPQAAAAERLLRDVA